MGGFAGVFVPEFQGNDCGLGQIFHTQHKDRVVGLAQLNVITERKRCGHHEAAALTFGTPDRVDVAF